MTDPGPTELQNDALALLERLTQFDGPPAQFWQSYFSALSAICHGCNGCVAIRSGSKWSQVASMPTGERVLDNFPEEQLEAWALETETSTPVVVSRLDGETFEQWAVVAALTPGAGDVLALTILLVEAAAKDVTFTILALANGITERFELGRQLAAARCDASRLANALDLMALLNRHTKFTAAAMALCNELTARFDCERASIGWLENNYIVVKAMSHTEKIEPQMEAVEQICALMEEACDQEEEIVWPRPERQAFITRDHEMREELDDFFLARRVGRMLGERFFPALLHCFVLAQPGQKIPRAGPHAKVLIAERLEEHVPAFAPETTRLNPEHSRSSFRVRRFQYAAYGSLRALKDGC